MVAKLKSLGTAILVVLFAVVGIRQCFYESVSVIGDVGMDDLGRQVFCQTFNRELRKSGDINAGCEGFHKQTLVISMRDATPILFGRIKPDDTIQQMGKPYTEALEGFSGLILRGDKMNNSLDDPTPIDEIAARLRKLGVKTIGDFYAACGFEKFIIRDEEGKTNYLELTFSNKQYGMNPVSTPDVRTHSFGGE